MHFKERFDNTRTENDYTTTLALSLDDFYSDTTPVKVSLRFTNYSGSYYYVDASPGGGNAVTYQFNDYLLGLGIYPLNFSIVRFIELNFGFQVDYIFYSRSEGVISFWSLSNPSGGKKSVDDQTGKIFVGLTGNLSLNFKLTEKVYIFPQYNYYMDFRNPRSKRHQLEVGIGKIIM